jgi:hypothetical protein
MRPIDGNPAGDDIGMNAVDLEMDARVAGVSVRRVGDVTDAPWEPSDAGVHHRVAAGSGTWNATVVTDYDALSDDA